MRLVLLLLLWASASSWGDLVALRGVESQLVRTRTTLETSLRQQVREIDQLKAEGTGPVGDGRLQKALASAQETGRTLMATEKQLHAKRREILEASDRLLQSTKDESMRTKLVQLRAEMAGALATPQSGNAILAALGVGESSSDGPEELREKADLLKDAQDKIERELVVLGRRYEVAQRRSDLLRSMHSLESNLFSEDVRRQRSSQLSGGTRAASEPSGRVLGPPTATSNNEAAAPPSAAPMPGSGPSGDTSGSGGTSMPTPPTAPGPVALVLTTAHSPLADVLVLKDLLDPTTLADLNQPKDSTAYLRGIERARKKLESIATELGRRSEVLRKRADELLPTRK